MARTKRPSPSKPTARKPSKAAKKTTKSRPASFPAGNPCGEIMVISRAPVRVSFLGGGTDFPEHFEKHGGMVLATAVDRYALVTVQPFLSAYFDHRIRLAYRKTEAVNHPSEIQHPAIRAALEKVGIGEGIEMHVMADLPARTGLGSSSTFVVAMLQSLHAHLGHYRSARELADEAIDIERNILREAGGWQDQILAAHGGLCLVNFQRGGSYQVQQLPMGAAKIRELEESMLLVYTQIQRDSHSVLGQACSIAPEAKIRVLERLARLAETGYECLLSGRPMESFGKLLHEGWELKKQAGSVSLPEIDDWYAKGLKHGATGGKLLGAGQGGFLLFIAKPEYHAAICKALGNRPFVKVRINAPGSQIIFSHHQSSNFR